MPPPRAPPQLVFSPGQLGMAPQERAPAGKWSRVSGLKMSSPYHEGPASISSFPEAASLLNAGSNWLKDETEPFATSPSSIFATRVHFSSAVLMTTSVLLFTVWIGHPLAQRYSKYIDTSPAAPMT